MSRFGSVRLARHYRNQMLARFEIQLCRTPLLNPRHQAHRARRQRNLKQLRPVLHTRRNIVRDKLLHAPDLHLRRARRSPRKVVVEFHSHPVRAVRCRRPTLRRRLRASRTGVPVPSAVCEVPAACPAGDVAGACEEDCVASSRSGACAAADAPAPAKTIITAAAMSLRILRPCYRKPGPRGMHHINAAL